MNEDFLDNDYKEPIIELVDLDEACWTRASYGASIEEMRWTAVQEALPPNIESRKTALTVEIPRAILACSKKIDGYRFKWMAACLSPGRGEVATAHGTEGTVWIADLQTGQVRKLPPVGATLFSLTWGPAGLIGIELQVPYLHFFNGEAWERREFGVGKKWAAPGRRMV